MCITKHPVLLTNFRHGVKAYMVSPSFYLSKRNKYKLIKDEEFSCDFGTFCSN
jgi:hypothetical protein